MDCNEPDKNKSSYGRRGLFLFIVLSMLLVICGQVAGIYAKSSAKNYFARDVIYLSPILNESHYHFYPDTIETLTMAYPEYTFSHEIRSGTWIGTTEKTMMTTVMLFYMLIMMMNIVKLIKMAYYALIIILKNEMMIFV